MAFNEAQKRAIRHTDGPALVLAGPGSGKTTVITNRVRYLTEKVGVEPGNILVITFTRAAAREMKERYERITGTGCSRVSFGTFHSVFFMILKLAYRYQASNIVKEEQRIQFIREQLDQTDLEIEDEGEFISSVLSEISLIKGELMSLDNYYAKSCSQTVFKELYDGYEHRLRKQGLLDFDDMLAMCYELFKERKDILQAWQRKYKYILIDEFQDINQIQYEIVKMLALPENNLFIVGDDDQSIYRFRGARPELMLGFEKDYPDAERILLDVNYRCVDPVIESAGKLIANNKTRFQKEIHGNRGKGCPVFVKEWPDPLAETKAITEELRDYHQMGIAYEDMAVLYRTNQGPRLLIERMMEYNIPFHMRDTVPNLYEHWIAKDIIAYMKIAMGSRYRKDFLKIMNRPKRYISRDSLDEETVAFDVWEWFYEDKPWVAERIQRLEYDIKMLSTMSPYAAINYIRRGIGYDEFCVEYADYRRMNVEDLYEVLEELQNSAKGFDTYNDWFEHIENYTAELEKIYRQQNQNPESVALATLHSSKGLEYDNVYIIDVNEGIMPYKKAVLDNEVEEERRMFYVGMTRAKKKLHLYSIEQLNHKNTDISRFIRESQKK